MNTTSPPCSLCPSCGSPVPVTEEYCDRCGYRVTFPVPGSPATPQTGPGFGQFLNQAVGSPAGSTPSPVSPGRIPPSPEPRLRRNAAVRVRIGLAIDRTASSNAFQQGVLQAAGNLFEALEKKSVAVEVWVQTHGDLDEGQLPLLICGGSDTATALAEIAGITYEGGGLPPENHLDAIESLLNSAPWGGGGPSCRDVIILLCTGPSKPAQSGVSPQDLAVRLKDLNILLAVVAEPVDPGNPSEELLHVRFHVVGHRDDTLTSRYSMASPQLRKTMILFTIPVPHTLIPGAQRRSAQIDSVEEHLEGLGAQAQLGPALLRGRPTEAAPLETFEARNTLPQEAMSFIIRGLDFVTRHQMERFSRRALALRSVEPRDAVDPRIQSSRVRPWRFAALEGYRSLPWW